MGKTIRRERAYFQDEQNHKRYVKQKRKQAKLLRVARHTREIANNVIGADFDKSSNSRERYDS